MSEILITRADADKLVGMDHSAARFQKFGERIMRSPVLTAILARKPNMRADAAAGLALQTQLTEYSAILTVQPLPELTSLAAFPGVPDQVAPWKKSYVVRDLRMAGGEVSRNYRDKGKAADVVVGVNAALPIVPCIGHCGYDLDEIEEAILGGVPLPMWKMTAVNRLIAETHNTENWYGNAALGIPGIYTATGITPTVVANGAGGSPKWSNSGVPVKTADEMIADFAQMLQTHMAKCKGIGELNRNLCLRMSQVCYVDASTRLLSLANSSGKFVLDVMLAMGKALDPSFTIESSPELAEVPAGLTGAGAQWMILYPKDGLVAGRLLALPTTFLAPDVETLSTTMIAHSQTGGLCVRRPVAVEIRYGM